MLTKQTKTQVIAEVRRTGKWRGWIVGCNVAPYHIKGGWHLGFSVDLFWDNEEQQACVVGKTLVRREGDNYVDVVYPLNSLLCDWAYYNANSETGYYAAYYRED